MQKTIIKIHKNLQLLKLLLLILIIFQAANFIKPKPDIIPAAVMQKPLTLEELTQKQPPKLLPELQGIDLEKIINSESI